jgi:hypothetical protein
MLMSFVAVYYFF